jgi:uncharacterized protein (TIGR04141 family)
MAINQPQRKVQHLTIYMVKEEIANLEQVTTLKADAATQFNVEIPGCNGILYVKREDGVTPSWVSLFSAFANSKDIGTISTLSAALVVKTAGRYFVLTFGNGRFLVGTDVFEERFGLHVVLNSVDENSIRVVDKQSLDAIQSHTRTQSGQETTADQFGLDVEQDMLKAIVGTPKTEQLGTRMTGSDSLSVSVRMELSDLPGLLKLYKQKFEEDLPADYAWVNNIRQVKKTSPIVAELDAILVEKLNRDEHERIWLSIPEVIDWTKVVGFMFTHTGRARHPDITLKGFLDSVDDDEQIDIQMLHTRDVMCSDADNRPVARKWSVYKCIYAEIDHSGEKYVLNGGTWFQVGSDFVKATNAQFSAARYSKLQLPDYAGGGEGTYNASVAKAQAAVFALLDKDLIIHGGSRGKVEVCDLLSSSKHLIHVKIYGRSSVLSHLFAQGFVSGQLIQLDREFRRKLKAKLKGAFAALVNVNSRPVDKEFTIIFAVISNAPGKALDLPFFSRVNFNNTARVLEGFGYNVELLKIEWDDNYAKTVVGAPGKKKRKLA